MIWLNSYINFMVIVLLFNIFMFKFFLFEIYFMGVDMVNIEDFNFILIYLF